MKKFVCFLLVVMMTLVPLCSCSGEPEIKDKDVTNVIDGGNNLPGQYASLIVYNFEEACRESNEIVVATFKGWKPYSTKYSELSFEIKETIFGNVSDDIKVYVGHNSLYYCGDIQVVVQYGHMELTVGNDYLILLEHYSSAYYKDVEPCFILGGTVIDVNDPSLGRMYDHPIADYSENFDFSKCGIEELKVYIKGLMKDISPGHIVSDSSDMGEILEQSTDVLAVRVDKFVRNSLSEFRDQGFYKCTVLETMKGKISQGSSVEICLHSGSVQEGDELIVALDNYDNAWYYRLTTKYAEFGMEQKEAILDLLNAGAK